jgi:two-component system, cell cycle sensor histidine kinase and response regulator CckA
VLVLEDNPAIATLLKTVLERRDYRVLTFGDPEAALPYFAADSRPVTFAIIDIGLAGMNGLEFARRFRPLQPKSRLIFTSGRPLEPEQLALPVCQGALFLPKPFNLSQLGKLVDEVERLAASS